MKTHLFFLITAVLLSAGQTGSAAITDGLIGHWTFNETSGTTASDTSGKNNHGTVSNSSGDNPQWGAGKIGGALGFRGPDNGADVVVVADFTKPTTTFSISAWVLADPRDGTWPQSVIVESGLGSGGAFGLVIRSKNRDQAFGPLGDTSSDVNGPTNERVSVLTIDIAELFRTQKPNRRG